MSDLNPFPWCSECASWHAPGHHLPDVSSDLAGQLRAKNAEVHTLLLKLDRYQHALKIIAGYRPALDNLMGNVDIAREALGDE